MPTKSNLQYTTEEKQDLDFFLKRKNQLIDFRTNSGIEKKWKQADADYEPHELGPAGKKVLVENERTEVSSYVNLNRDQWRSRIASNEPYIKIQTAISILFDRNPEAVFDPMARRYEANSRFMEQLYHRTWADVNLGSKKELRKFIFNVAKYGWAPARRYYKRLVRKDLNLIKRYNLETKQFEYEKKDLTDVDDVYFESKSPWDVWIDDMAKPDDPRSRRDWMWREVFDKSTFESLWGEGKNSGLVDFATISPDVSSDGRDAKDYKRVNYTSDDLVVVWFYENRLTDRLMVVTDNDLLLESNPIPRSDKETSLVDTYWTLRSTESPYGIGLNEIMRGNKVLLDKVRNMTIDQVVLSIYKMFFYSNTEQLDDEGGEVITLDPGKGKKVIDPKNITWFDVPGPGRDAFEMLERIDKNIEDDTGVTKTLEGEITGKTAFEIAQAQQGALKRLATPLRNIKSALEWDAKLCVNLMKMVYSVPKVFSFTDPELIQEYVTSVEDDKELYFTDASGVFNVLKYREFQLNIEKNSEDVFEGSENKQFFTAKPSYLEWEGEISIRVESMIEMSKPAERELKLQMSNILLPLIGQMAANPMLIPIYLKPVKQILKLYNENPSDWVPSQWLSGEMAQGLPAGQMMPAGGAAGTMQVAPESVFSPRSVETEQLSNANQQVM